jgi:agmatinase
VVESGQIARQNRTYEENLVSPSDEDRVDREGYRAQQAEAKLSTRRYQEEIERGLSYGLEAADSITDRSLPTFARGEIPHFAGERGTFLKCPYVEDVHEVGDAEVAIFGAPLDAGTTYRPGTRFGPQGIRRATKTCSAPTTTRWASTCASS